MLTTVSRKYGQVELQLEITTEGKKAKVNGIEQKKLSDFIGTLNVVLFSPEDLDLVKGTPSVRRRFLDMEIAQVQPSYLYALNQYYKVLNQRNNYMRVNKVNHNDQDHLMSVWNEQLVQYAIKIMVKRQNFIQKLQHWADKTHDGITAGLEKIQIKYNPSVVLSASDDEAMLFEQFMVKLIQSRDQELTRGTTMIGPHRDDLLLLLDGRELRTFGSAGQQRSAALALRLREAATVHAALGAPPLLLLDDPFAELDPSRSAAALQLVASTASGQVVLAVPRASDIPEAFTALPRFTMRHG
jgi:DNA replication and repair protein RecF